MRDSESAAIACAGHEGPEASERCGPAEGVPLHTLLEMWVTDGVISAEQGARIAARGDVVVRPDSAPRSRAGRSLAAEALAYLGGVVVVVSTILIANLYWAHLALGSRLTMLAAAAAALFGCGLAVPRRLAQTGVRLRSVLWLASTVSVAGLLSILCADGLGLSDGDTAVVTGAGTATAAAALWWGHRHLVQQVVTMVSLMVTAVAAIADFVNPEHLPGVGAWLVGMSWLALGLRGTLTPQRPVLALSAAAAIVGGMATLPADWGFLLALATVAGVLALAVRRADLLLLSIVAAGTLGVLPAAVNEWFPGSAAVPFVLLAVGLLLVVVAVRTARRHADRQASVAPHA
jgi:hypothetical protein